VQDGQGVDVKLKVSGVTNHHQEAEN